VDILADIKFEERDLPPFAELIGDTGLYRDYVRSRCVPDDYPVMTQTNPERAWPSRDQVIIPFTHHNSIVGHTIRFLDDRNPRYINDMQPGYVFGTDLQRPDWTQVIITEGIFDALSIGGLALMHNTISDAQAQLIRNLGREITVVPDQDSAGMELVDRAVELGWAVSMPAWEDCKDVNDAVKKYGRLGALITIMQARETSRIKIELRKKQLVKRLQH
jgi:DNA primase